MCIRKNTTSSKPNLLCMPSNIFAVSDSPIAIGTTDVRVVAINRITNIRFLSQYLFFRLAEKRVLNQLK
jgi:hypothetical protein